MCFRSASLNSGFLIRTPLWLTNQHGASDSVPRDQKIGATWSLLFELQEKSPGAKKPGHVGGKLSHGMEPSDRTLATQRFVEVKAGARAAIGH